MVNWGHLHDPDVGAIEKGSGDRLEKQKSHHSEDQVHGELTDHFVDRFRIVHEEFYWFEHSQPFL